MLLIHVYRHIAVIRHCFGSAGICDVLIEADVLASGSVDSVLDGKHYNRGIHAQKIVAEAMDRLRWVTFLEWNENQHDAVDKFTHTMTFMIQL